MKKIILISIIIFLNVGGAFSQINLVPNPSFEIYDTCPCGYNQIYQATPWYNADVYTFIQYLNACSLYGSTNGVPKNAWGYQNAHTGVAYASYGGYSDYNPSSERCYIGVELTDSLIEGKRYCISFYVSLADSSKYAITRIGAYLSDTIILKTTGSPHGPFPFTPQIESPSGVYLNDTVNWTLISGEYIATGGEKYITIGNYHDNASTDTMSTGVISINYNYHGAFYYLDDVSVTLCDTVSINESISNVNGNLIIYPNPASDKLTIKNTCAEEITDIYISNSLGLKINEFSCNSSGLKTIDISEYKSGVYFLKYQLFNKTYTQKLIIIN